MIRTAVIVAAGSGSRMGQRTESLPKGFLELGGKPLIVQSVEKLFQAGIEKIVIGTGHASEAYERLAAEFPHKIICIHNTNYASTGSLSTLYRMKSYVGEDCLLLESDLIYERAALSELIGHPAEDVILASDWTHSGDEVFIETNEKRHLVNMTKTPAKESRMYAELVGITKLSLPVFRSMCAFAEKALKQNSGLNYEDALSAIAGEVPITVHKMFDLAWCEVDDENHLRRAEDVIYPLIAARDSVPKKVKRNVLLNPGPATTTDSVKYAQVVPDICPREAEFGQVMAYIAEELTKFVANPADAYTTVLFGGSGTAAVEAMLSSVVGHDESVLIVNNGAYGERMCRIAEIYGINYIAFESPAEREIDLRELEAAIQRAGDGRSGGISHLAIVHCETTTGLLNDIEAVGSICAKCGLSMMVDAISSYAAIPIDMQRMHIRFLAASSNKNLQGIAGVSFVIAERASLKRTRSVKPRSLYLHLYEQSEHFERTGQMRFTPPVQTLYSLKQAIIETKKEGISNRYRRYSRSWEALIAGIERLGLTYAVHPDHHSRIITSILEPIHEKYDFQAMHDFFYRRGFTIYPGKLHALNTFRVANIGAITYLDMETFISLLSQYLFELNA